MDRKKNILITALRLFAINGYEAVSVNQIATELGITKGALYKHYKNKRDIFDSIFEYVCQLDIERSKKAGVPEKEFAQMPDSFSNTSIENLKEYMTQQFYYWSEDEIACHFRKLLTLEQYKTPKMNMLYQKIFVSGPLNYIEDLFREIMKEKETFQNTPKQMAIAFYAPFYFLLNMSDALTHKEEKKKIAEMYIKYMEHFLKQF